MTIQNLHFYALIALLTCMQSMESTTVCEYQGFFLLALKNKVSFMSKEVIYHIGVFSGTSSSFIYSIYNEVSYQKESKWCLFLTWL